MPMTHEFAYDVTIKGVIRVTTELSEAEVSAKLDDDVVSLMAQLPGWTDPAVITEITVYDAELFEVDGLDREEVCDTEDCWSSLQDGEGYDGYCGSCADKLEEAGHWS